MTEAQIEARVERMMDHLDRLLLTGEMSPKDYAAAVADLDVWVKAKQDQRGTHR